MGLLLIIIIVYHQHGLRLGYSEAKTINRRLLLDRHVCGSSLPNTQDGRNHVDGMIHAHANNAIEFPGVNVRWRHQIQNRAGIFIRLDVQRPVGYLLLRSRNVSASCIQRK